MGQDNSTNDEERFEEERQKLQNTELDEEKKPQNLMTPKELNRALKDAKKLSNAAESEMKKINKELSRKNDDIDKKTEKHNRTAGKIKSNQVNLKSMLAERKEKTDSLQKNVDSINTKRNNLIALNTKLIEQTQHFEKNPKELEGITQKDIDRLTKQNQHKIQSLQKKISLAEKDLEAAEKYHSKLRKDFKSYDKGLRKKEGKILDRDSSLQDKVTRRGIKVDNALDDKEKLLSGEELKKNLLKDKMLNKGETLSKEAIAGPLSQARTESINGKYKAGLTNE